MRGSTADMAAFGASEAACYKWPADSEIDRACRAAFCDGAAWSATEIDRLRAALLEADAAINPPDRGGISLEKWNERLKAATAKMRAALSIVEAP